MIIRIEISKSAEKDLQKVPLFIANKLKFWIAMVEMEGLLATRRIKGFHDEILAGKRFGQRSIRLNKAYRAIYIVRQNSEIEFISIEEVHKHEY